MLKKAVSFEEIDGRKLMDLYQEGNRINRDYFYPEMTDRALALQKCEEDFLNYLKTDFFQRESSTYWILEEENVWISALRLYRIADGHYYIEALETHPEFRKRGFASRLLKGVIGELKSEGPFRLCDCVGKTNEASVRTHKKCGFEIVSENAFDYLRSETCDWEYGMEFCHAASAEESTSISSKLVSV